MTTPNLERPQIAAARAQAWRQTGEALLTLEAARAWIGEFGLVSFSPIAGTLGVPAPSLVEATLGEARPSATLAETATARSLTARLVAEGTALPLNLLGGPGDLPDFVVAAHTFPLVFTLRGDKGWKRPPETTGSVRVTPLALRVYEVLTERGAMSLADLVSEIGREVTESAVARGLSELWQLLRVIPLLQPDSEATLWELTTTRFLKAVKAGANAGQPTALSGLVSLYLEQALVATEEEISGFLSPLTARSRVREVLHGLTAGKQLEEGALEGKTVVFIPERLPDFALFESKADAERPDEAGAEDTEAAQAADGSEPAFAENAGRIRRFEAEGATDRGLRGKPVRREGASKSRGFGARPAAGGFRPDARKGPSGPRAARPFPPRGNGVDRPFRPAADNDRGFRRDAGASERPRFDRPWTEDRPSSKAPREGGDRPFRPREGGGDRPFRSREEGGRPFRPREGGERPFRPREDRRPPREAAGEGERPSFARRSFRPEGGAGGPDRGSRGFGSGERSPRLFTRDRGPRDFGGERAQSGDRPRSRNEGGQERRPFRPQGSERPFRPRQDAGAEGRPPRREGDRPFRAQAGFRSEGGPPARFPKGPGAGNRPFKPFGADRPATREGGGEGRPARRPFGTGSAGKGGPPRGPRPQGSFGDRQGAGSGGAGGSRLGGPTGGGFGDRPKRPGGPPRPKGPGRPRRPEDEA